MNNQQDLQKYKEWLRSGEISVAERKSFVNAVEHLTALEQGINPNKMPSARYKAVLRTRTAKCDRARKALFNEQSFSNYVADDKTPEGIAYRLSLYVNSFESGYGWTEVSKRFSRGVLVYASGKSLPPKKRCDEFHEKLKQEGF